MASKKDMERRFTEAYTQLSPEAQKFVFNVTMGMALKHRETPNLDDSLLCRVLYHTALHEDRLV